MKKTKIADLVKDSFCGTTSAAKVLGLSVGTVQNLVETNKLQAWKTEGGHRRISMKSILAYQKVNGKQDVYVNSVESFFQVIIVEDDENTRNMFEAYFERWSLPLDLIIYSSAMNALMDWHSLVPVVVLTDLKMPNMNGFDFIKTIINKKKSTLMPIIAITGLTDDEINSHGGLPDDVFIMKKPLDMEWLKGFLQGVLSLSELDSTAGLGKISHDV